MPSRVFTRETQDAALGRIFERSGAYIGARTMARRIVRVNGAKFKRPENNRDAAKLRGRTFASVYGQLRRLYNAAYGTTAATETF